MCKGKKFSVVVMLIVLTASVLAFAAGSKEAAASEIVIGSVQDITGPTSSLGKMVDSGARLAIDEVNAKGGVNGKTIRIITYDTKGDVNEAINAFTRAVTTDKVSALIGPPVANIALALAPISERYSVPFLNLAIDPKVQIKADGTPYKNMFGMQPSADQQGSIMAQYAIEKRGFGKFGIIYNESNAYAVSLLAPFVDTVKANGKTVAVTTSYTANDKDFKTLLNNILQAGVDAIYSPGYTQELILITQQARAMGFKGALIYGLDAGPPFNNLLGESADNIYFINNIDTTEPHLEAITKSVKATQNIDVTNKFFLGYDIGNILVQALGAVGSDSVAIRDYVENLKGYQGLTGVITMDAKTHFPLGLEMVMHTYEGTTPVVLERYSASY
ncbi:ABC transporter substrate-binding protein [Parasphaerochaeta coccoides]|uniref:Extracellular ligand-binding receptor n=1 Tax=Parasphaerochaeta coccoides (strain ATCC BAA-1237 / DSM 17374 / SPN1) TaxID=760011 RepID=F4GJN5_PARC1|nr:ABC transporter substrate-binding protein [Parasphaerochaeta coccoides]AEC02782.1 Extracellular ligand-binding receptor [Parasphaerochaeta coccoides DSM 17374]